MVNYECNICNFTTKNKRNYIQHTETQKHIKKVTDDTNNKQPHIDKSDEIYTGTSQTPHGASPTPQNELNNKNSGNSGNNNDGLICEFCLISYSRMGSLTRHKKICSNKYKYEKELTLENQIASLNAKLAQSEKDKEASIQLLNTQLKQYKKENKHYMEETNYYKKMLCEAGGLVKKSVSTLSYVAKNYDSAPALETIAVKEIDYFNDTEKKITEDILSSYKHKTLGKYLGDFIIIAYKKNNPENQSIWNTDDSRLTYIIKELMHNNSSNWVIDKKGVKTTTYLIEPLLAHVKELLISYQTRQVIPDLRQNSTEIEFILENSRIMINLVNDIDDGYVAKDILKHISIHLKFNTKSLE